MNPIQYHTAGLEDLEQIRPLWTKLNLRHYHLTTGFHNHYQKMTFEERKAYFKKIASEGTLRLDIAFDTGTKSYVGYCISSISKDDNGEIESIFIEDEYRCREIGTKLMKRALGWFERNCSNRIRVLVAEGNEEVFKFLPEIWILSTPYCSRTDLRKDILNI